jgi:hypothetical protein
VHGLEPVEHQTEHGANGGGLHHGIESLIKIHARALGEPPEDPTPLIHVNRTVNLKLVLEDPLDGISLVLLVFVVLCMVVYCWSFWSFVWWLEGQHLRLASWNMLGCLGQL